MAETAVNTQHLINKTTEMTLAKSHPENHDNNALNLILQSNLFNFIIVLAVVIWLIRKVDVASLIAKKQAEIAESIKNAEDEKKVKQNYLAVTKNKVANADQEVTKIIKEGEHIARNISESISEDAGKQAEELGKKAVISVENQKQVISGEVMTKITSAAFYVAEEHIKQSIDERLHYKFIDDFINEPDIICPQ